MRNCLFMIRQISQLSTCNASEICKAEPQSGSIESYVFPGVKINSVRQQYHTSLAGAFLQWSIQTTSWTCNNILAINLLLVQRVAKAFNSGSSFTFDYME